MHDPNLRYQDKSCFNCRYYRQHTTGCTISCCLRLGRDLSAHSSLFNFFYVDQSRVCDLWKRRPDKWIIGTIGTNSSPYWVDPYITRKQIERWVSQLSRGKT